MIKRFVDPIYGSKVELRTDNDILFDDGKLRDGSCEKLQRIVGNVRWYKYRVNIRDTKELSILVHECLHLTRMILEHHCVPFREENDEAIAYHQEYWFKKLLKAIQSG